MEERIKTNITIDYVTTNSEGKETIKVNADIEVSDQSQKSASLMLLNTVNGLLSGADAQVEE